MAMRLRLLLLSLALLALQPCDALDNGLALTPPMGWLSWERFRCVTNCTEQPSACISASLYMEMADRLVADGYAAVGYTQVNVDDCYLAVQRNAKGQLEADPARFPGGINALADYVHGQGLKLGVYEDFGTETCGGYPGSEYHIATDAQTFMQWQVDMLKLDGCNSNVSDMAWGYPAMGAALNATGRPIVYSCSWPDYVRVNGGTNNYTNIGRYCNLWRLYDDIQDSWDSVLSIIDYWGDNQDTLVPAAGPGRWNDMDMLIIGDFGLSPDQSRAQMALWSINASPLLMSNDLRNISDWAAEILLNKEVIAVDQDALGRQGTRVFQDNGLEIWRRTI